MTHLADRTTSLEQRIQQLSTKISALACIIQETLSPHFDFDIITRQTLGKHWRKANDAERLEVQTLFRGLLEKTYANALAKFTDENVSVDEVEEAKGGSIVVPLIIESKGKKISLEYLLKEFDGKWAIIDVKIENVSLLGNYRRQFNSIIRKDGIEGLVELLKSKA